MDTQTTTRRQSASANRASRARVQTIDDQHAPVIVDSCLAGRVVINMTALTYLSVPSRDGTNLALIDAPKMPRPSTAVGVLLAALATDTGIDPYDATSLRLAATRGYNSATRIDAAIADTLWYMTQSADRGSLPGKGWVVQCAQAHNPDRVLYRIDPVQARMIDADYRASARKRVTGHIGAARRAVTAMWTRATVRDVAASGRVLAMLTDNPAS